jgi:ABC-type iron transport system FetAB ATPase subunit
MMAIVGQWLLSAKLGCSLHMPEWLPKTHKLQQTRHFQCDMSAVFYPGDKATLLIALSSSGKSTLMKTIANLCQEQTQLKTKGTLLVGACDPADPRYTVVVFVVRLPLPIRGTT